MAGPLSWTYLVKTIKADTCICYQAGINTTTPEWHLTSTPDKAQYHPLYDCLWLTSLENDLCFQGHFFSSWPRCYGNFQPPPPPSPWNRDKRDKQDISSEKPVPPTHQHSGYMALHLVFKTTIWYEKKEKKEKVQHNKCANMRSLTCSSLDRTTLLMSIGLGLNPFAWKCWKSSIFTVRYSMLVVINQHSRFLLQSSQNKDIGIAWHKCTQTGLQLLMVSTQRHRMCLSD